MKVQWAIIFILVSLASAQINNGGGTSTGTVTTAFVPIQSNPILSPAAGELFIFGQVFKDGGTWYYYYMYEQDGTTESIGRATSSDGINWTKDAGHNPLFVPDGASNWDNTAVGSPNVWKEGSNWYMLFRGRGTGDNKSRVGFATSSDGITWTRTPTNLCAAPAQTGNGCVIDIGLNADGSEIEPWGVFKVGSTYYLGLTNPIPPTRGDGEATSTDLIHWTKDPNNPTFTNGRFDQAFFKIGNYYYDIVDHYVDQADGNTANAELELYRSASPVFTPANRTFLGIVLQNAGAVQNGKVLAWDSFALDGPFVLTDDITRSSYTVSGGDIWLYYSGTDTANHAQFYNGLAISAQQSVPIATIQGQSGYLPNGGYIYNNVAAFRGDVQSNGANGFWALVSTAAFFWNGSTEMLNVADGTMRVTDHTATDGTIRARYHLHFPVTFSTLAACAAGTEGDTAGVTDSTVATWGTAIAGGGSNHVLAYCDGTSWKVAAP